jgi:hypothetical protein
MHASYEIRVALVMLLMLGFATEVSAGKYCGDSIESGLSSEATQEKAMIAAQEWWSSRAGALGRGYESWDNSEDRAMECSKTDRGMFQCKASGRPCLPDGTLPDNVPKIDM